MASTWSKCASLFRSQKIVKNLRILGKLSIPTGVTICALPVFGCKKPIQEVGERLQVKVNTYATSLGSIFLFGHESCLK